MAREFNVTVWATDLWFNATDNWKRVSDAGVENSVYPIHADARSLPFASEFFDAVISVDSFPYYGTDDHYLNYLARLVKPEKVIAIVGSGMTHEIEGSLPDHLRTWWTAEPGMWCLHSPEWWSRHWERTGIVDVELADTMPDGWQYWLKWHRLVAPDNLVEIDSLENDRGDHLGYVRVICRRRPNVQLDEPLVSIPSQYVQKPLLRGGL